ncbi:MAG: ABC transporter ATP-binding protein [Bacteroidota bacterium]
MSQSPSLTRYILRHIRPFIPHILVMILTASLQAGVNIVAPYLLKIITNRVLYLNADNIVQGLWYPILTYIVLHVLIELFWRLRTYFVDIRMDPQICQNIREEYAERIINKNYTFHQNNYKSYLVHNAVQLSNNVPKIIETFFLRMLVMILSLIAGFYALYQASYQFALLLGIWTCIFFLTIFLANKFVIKRAIQWAKRNSEVAGVIGDSFSNILAVKFFGRQDEEKRVIGDSLTKATQAHRAMSWRYLGIYTLLSIAYLILQTFNFILLVRGRMQGTLSVGDFGYVLGVNLSIILMCWWNIQQFSELSKIIGESKQALTILETPMQFYDHPNAKILQIKKGNIVFKNVTFEYPQSEQPVLENLALTIPAGQKLGIVGYSGGGKTTLIRLLLLLYKLQKGEILVDDQSISEVTEHSLREAIGIVPQESLLFNRSLRDNIVYGKPDATDEEIIDAAKKAYIHDFIQELPEGYSTLVGDRGARISGGQKQRVAMARTILKNPPILVFDEATSQLDTVTEEYIQQSMYQLMKGKTTIVIAHRLATLDKMDRIIVVENGKIVEDGTHQQLLAKKGSYHTLWNTQVNGILPTSKKV